MINILLWVLVVGLVFDSFVLFRRVRQLKKRCCAIEADLANVIRYRSGGGPSQ